MNKTLITALLAGLFMSSSAFAEPNVGTMSFSGVVSSMTCDIYSEVDGVKTSHVDLGIVNIGAEGKARTILLKPSAGSQCAKPGVEKDASVVWSSAALNAEGIGNIGGIAVDSTVLMKAEPSNVPSVPIHDGQTKADFPADDASGDKAKGMKFAAKLKGGNTAGTFKSIASYTVAYK